MKLFGGGKKAHKGAVKADSESGNEFVNFIPDFGDKMETVVIRPGKKKRGAFKKLLTILGAAIALCLVLVIAYTLWEKAPDTENDGPISVSREDKEALGDAEAPVLNLPLTEVENGSAEEPSATGDSVEETPAISENVRNTDCYTFVLAAYDQIGASTDTILVGRMDIKEGTLNVVSIPRDTLVNVSWGVKKINTVMVYEENDPERFIDELSSILGFNVDCYAFVDIKAMEEMIDAIGGVKYNVRRNMDYDDPTQDLHIHIPAGEQWLSGEQAVQVLRYRVGNDNTGYPNGDLGRIGTQHDFLMSVASQMLSVGNIPNLSKAIEIFEKYVLTDLSANNIAFFVHEFLKMDPENIHFDMVPGEGIAIRSGSYYEIDVIAWTEMINAYLNPFSVDIGTHNLDVLDYNPENGSVMSTTGEIIAYESFYDFTTYKG